jgi:hypothetical protein
MINRWKKGWVGIGLAGLCMVSEASDALWQTAVEVASNSRDWVPGEVRTVEQELDKKGRVKGEEEMLIYVRKGETGGLDRVYFKIENGDQTPYTPEEEEEDDDTISFGPLDMEAQERVVVRRTGEVEAVNNRQCARYLYEMPDPEEGGLLRGSVWVDVQSGMPVRMTIEPDPYPEGIKQLSMELDFVSIEAGTVQPGKMIAEATISGWFSQGKYRVVQTFGAFWRRTLPDA